MTKLVTITDNCETVRLHTNFKFWEWAEFRSFDYLDQDIVHDNYTLGIL